MRLIVGITGASGVILAVRLLDVLRRLDAVETHLIVSPSGARTIAWETPYSLDDVRALADVTYRYADVAAAPSSGSARMDAMVVVPCTMRTASAIARSLSDDLITRAADVMLKERRPLVVVPRETPMHVGHLRCLVELAEIGALISPPVPSFYQRPQTLDDLIDHTVARLLDHLGIDPPEEMIQRWKGIPT